MLVDNTMGAASNIESDMYRVQQKVKEQKLTSMDMRNK
jgi:hypothetical protein